MHWLICSYCYGWCNYGTVVYTQCKARFWPETSFIIVSQGGRTQQSAQFGTQAPTLSVLVSHFPFLCRLCKLWHLKVKKNQRLLGCRAAGGRNPVWFPRPVPAISTVLVCPRDPGISILSSLLWSGWTGMLTWCRPGVGLSVWCPLISKATLSCVHRKP